MYENTFNESQIEGIELDFSIKQIITSLLLFLGMSFFIYFLWSKAGNKVRKIFRRKKKAIYSGTTPVLVSDIGGTNCRLKLLQVSYDEEEEPEEIAKEVLKPWSYNSIESLLKTFLKPYEGTDKYPRYAVLGIPGAIVNNTMLELVNIPNWKRTNGDQLAKQLKLKKLIFLNDFVCNGYGIQAKLKEGKDYIKLNNNKENSKDKRLVIGPGTGLGVCYLIKNDYEKYYNIYASEGGHIDFAPKNQIQFQYLEFLQKYFGIQNISAEKACSGPALIPIYKYLQGVYKNTQVDSDLAKAVSKISSASSSVEVNLVNDEIVTKGLNGNCALSRLVLEFFVELLGNISGNMSVYTLPYGGIYIVGGLSATIQKIYKSGIFQKALMSRGEQNQLLKDIPIILILENNLGMIGATECARRMVLEEVNLVSC